MGWANVNGKKSAGRGVERRAGPVHRSGSRALRFNKAETGGRKGQK
jgi:hypothetical protein